VNPFTSHTSYKENQDLMKRNLIGRGLAATTAVAVAAGIGLVAVPAHAASIDPSGPAPAEIAGRLAIAPATGIGALNATLTTDGACAAPAAMVRVVLNGPGLVDATLYAPSSIGFRTTGTMSVGTSQSFAETALNESVALNGRYQARFQCVDALGSQIYREWGVFMDWTTATSGGTLADRLDAATYTTEAIEAKTSTTLVASPAATALRDTNVDLTATVTPQFGAAPSTGTVQFKDGATNLGSPVAVSGGQATLSTTALPVGTRSLTAVYSGATGIETSTSAPVSYTITKPAAVATTVTLTNTGGTTVGTDAVLNAVVAPNNAVGSVRFLEGATVRGNVAVVSGVAVVNVPNTAAGLRTFTAEFIPADPTDFVASTSSPLDVTVVSLPTVYTEQIDVEVPAGTLTLALAPTYDGRVLLEPQLNADNSLYVATGALDPVRVTDTRAGSLGWTVEGQLTPFTQGGQNSIAGVNLGWDPNSAVQNARQVVADGSTVAAANGVAIGSGQGWTRTLASSAAGDSVGQATLGADLTLQAPTTTTVGTHTAFLTLTVIPLP
jgi:hypothetical protein